MEGDLESSEVIKKGDSVGMTLSGPNWVGTFEVRVDKMKRT
jgi:hypothetical protein